jgi:hypothetical protein
MWEKYAAKGQIKERGKLEVATAEGARRGQAWKTSGPALARAASKPLTTRGLVPVTPSVMRLERHTPRLRWVFQGHQ